MNAIEAIRKRTSVRNYFPEPLTPALIEDLRREIRLLEPGPFGNSARIVLIDANSESNTKLNSLVTYGVIKNAPAYIVAAIEENPGSLEDFGYILERLVITLTQKSLGSCWLGGTFNKSAFSAQIRLRENEILPAIISFGKPKQKTTVIDKLFRWGAKSDKRRDWNLLFFEDDFTIPLTRQRAGIFEEPLALLRLAPSASNMQPWRILKQNNSFHFYLRGSKKYRMDRFQLPNLQQIDLGIAMAHFDLGLEASNVIKKKGIWKKTPPSIQNMPKDFSYIITWKHNI